MREEPTTAELTKGIIDALGKAAGAAGQLVHTHGHPGFIMIRDAIDLVKEGVTLAAMREYDKFYKLVP